MQVYVTACILEQSAYILKRSGTFCMHSGTFWNVLELSRTFCYYIECCKKVEYQLGDGYTDRQTDRH